MGEVTPAGPTADEEVELLAQLQQQVGARIREARRARRVSQESLAETLGVSRQTVVAWEAGQFAPMLPKVVQIAEYFGVSVDWLLGRTSQQAGDDFGTRLLAAALALPREQRDALLLLAESTIRLPNRSDE